MALRLLLSACKHQQPLLAKQLLPAACAALQAAPSAIQAPAAELLQQAKASFHSSTLTLSSDLPSILTKEIKHEKAVAEKSDVVAAGPPAPFVLHSKLGDTAVSLTRDFKDEKISVDCSVNMQDSLGGLPLGGDEEEEEDDDDEAADVQFNVTVTKADKALVFECVSDGTYLDIRHVSLEPAEGNDSETVFTGPVFSELDNELQEAFRRYVAERGINEDMGEYLRHLMFDKEQEEYVHWLEGVKTFLGSSS
ncbi:mitochondrial glycoprotein [Scenedesmus sp. NREL 46B-D3]|nr:mitochondrial glycoprotein [Scenedesmus sp. NREL 46B-D3]